MHESPQESIARSQRVPVVAEVDVLVAGGGIAGCVAAVTAARHGASVMVVERFGALGGNMGPGMFSGGVVHLCLVRPDAMPEGLRGIPGEFLNRCAGHVNGQLGHHYHRDSEVVAYVWLKMFAENNVRVMLNTVGAEPIMEGTRITGLFVENASGSQAVRAKVVIDCTGEADVAARAGAETEPGYTYTHPGMYFTIADVDEARYQQFAAAAGEPDAETLAWARDWCRKLSGMGWRDSFNPMLRQIRAAYQTRAYNFLQPIDDLGTVWPDHGLYFRPAHPGLVGAQVGVHGPRLACGDAATMTRLETGVRAYIFETAQFLRQQIPGFERSYLHNIAPYFHSRGGRGAVCDMRLTVDDVASGARFDDVVFRAWGHEVKPGEYTEDGFDFPYRQLLPRGVEGLLAAGRSAILQKPQNRTRYKVMLQGQAAGLAAALAAQAGLTPRALPVRQLQQRLLTHHHVMLGEPERLRELGLTGLDGAS